MPLYYPSTPGSWNLIGGDFQRILFPVGGLADITVTTTSQTAYWCYLGYTSTSKNIKYVKIFLATVGSGSQAAEFALASTTSAPNGSSMTLSKLVADGTLTAMTVAGGGASTTVIQNTTAFNSGSGFVVGGGIHLWAGFRTQMGTTQPTVQAADVTMPTGLFLKTAATGALTGSTSWTGSTIAATTSADGVNLRAVMD